MCRFKPLGPDMSVELAPPNIVGRIEGALVCRYTKSRVLLSRQLGDTRLQISLKNRLFSHGYLIKKIGLKMPQEETLKLSGYLDRSSSYCLKNCNPLPTLVASEKKIRKIIFFPELWPLVGTAIAAHGHRVPSLGRGLAQIWALHPHQPLHT